jgi:hypothetical protein
MLIFLISVSFKKSPVLKSEFGDKYNLRRLNHFSNDISPKSRRQKSRISNDSGFSMN